MNKPKNGKRSFRNISTFLKIIRVGYTLKPWVTIFYALSAALETAAFLTTLYASAQLAGNLATFSTGGATSELWFWLWVDVIAAAVTGLSFWIMNWCKRIAYFAIVQWSTSQFMELLCRLDIPDFYNSSMRNKINKVQAGYIWQLPNFFEVSLDLIYALVRFVATAVVVATITWWVVPVIAIFLIPTLFVEKRLAKIQWFVWNVQGDWRHIFWGLEYMMRTAKGQMELRSLQARSYVLDKISRMNHRFYGQQTSQLNHANHLMGPSKILEVGGTAAGSIVLLRQFIVGSLTLERYFFLSGALLRIGGALNNIFGTLSRMQESILFAQSYFELIEHKEKYVDKPLAKQITTKKPPRIELKNIYFTYPESNKPIFTNFSLVIEPAEHIALVGENGAGKSTLIKLLLRFYVPDSGQILINGENLQDIAIESWYEQLATLFQSFNEYPLPIKENVTIARPEYAQDELRLSRAAKASKVDTIVSSYKHGWDTVLDNSFEKGIEPSGGQWQRVALARAFFRQANVLILDEPTSAIDAKAEYDIFNSIFETYRNRTAIIVSHRFSTVRRASRIVVIDQGQIIEQGTHSELMKKHGLYHELFSKQAEGYKD